ncbi:MAG: Maf-like protein [Bacteroidaceae bacterium]|nr:Maf-like protein [Bacteroidaceae bacterium]
MIQSLDKYRVVLASNSPRRKELLAGLGIQFEVRTGIEVDESFPVTLPAEEVAEYISHKKAHAYLPTLASDELLITADTIVTIDGEILGKPKDREDAFRMLRQLAGRVHKVITGVTIVKDGNVKSFSSVTNVTFANLTDEEIAYYVDNYKPFDKAGAYGIQEWIGFVGVKHIEGSYFNVMGLPIQRLYEEI